MNAFLLQRSGVAAMLVSQGNATSKVRDVTLYELQMRGYRLTTAEIVYRLPDHPALLQTFIWQKFDLAPDFPELHKFLEFWKANIEGPLHSVNVKQSSRTAANRFRHFKHSLTLH